MGLAGERGGGEGGKAKGDGRDIHGHRGGIYGKVCCTYLDDTRIKNQL